MKHSDHSKRRFLKLVAGVGLLIPGTSLCLSSNGFLGAWQRLTEKILTDAVPRRCPFTASRKEEEAIILYRTDNRSDLLKINETAAHIWRLCDGRHRIYDIGEKLSSQFDVPLSQGVKDAAYVVAVYRRYGVVEI